MSAARASKSGTTGSAPAAVSTESYEGLREAVTRSPVGLDFTALVDAIRQVHEHSAATVSRVVNTSLTLRNWTIGAYIHHYELNGADRAEYGEGLIDRLAAALGRASVTACDRIRLYAGRC